MTSQKHNQKIDFLRGVAIIYVVIYHYQLVLFSDYPVTKYNENGVIETTGIKSLLLNFSPSAFGYTGVLLFLIISGFLIHLGYLKGGQKFKAPDFFSKRFWRIFPPYWFALIAITAYINRHDFSGISIKDFALHFITVHNLFRSTFFSINPSFWSLALEVQLYLLYPIFLFLRSKMGIKAAFLLILIVSFVFLIFGIIFQLFNNHAPYTNSVFLLWFIWGGGAYYAEMFFNDKRLFHNGALTTSIISFILLIACKYYLYSNYLLLYISTLSWVAFIDWFLNNDKLKLKNIFGSWTVKIGLYSYSLYLIHQPLLYVFYNIYNKYLRLHFNHPFLMIIPIFVFLLLISFIMYHLIELPSISIGAKLRNKRS